MRFGVCYLTGDTKIRLAAVQNNSKRYVPINTKPLDTITKKSLLILGAIVIFLVLYFRWNRCECEARISYADVELNRGLDLDRLYQPTDSTELQEIIRSWERTNLLGDSFQITAQIKYTSKRELQIVAQYANGQKHYAAIMLPANFDSLQTYPIAVWANGLDQANPSVNLQNSVIRDFIAALPDHYILIPSYRGQALVLNQQRFCSDGFFGDAFDGATEDALRLLELTRKEFTGADSKQVTVCGVSRGGTVALLMGARDTTIKNIVSIAGPTNFFSRDVYHRYGRQYKYQFLSKTTSVPDLRKKMIASSPLFFLEQFPNNILLIHGRNDLVVPISNAEEVIKRLAARDNFTSIINDGGHRFDGWKQVMEWIRANG